MGVQRSEQEDYILSLKAPELVYRYYISLPPKEREALLAEQSLRGEKLRSSLAERRKILRLDEKISTAPFGGRD